MSAKSAMPALELIAGQAMKLENVRNYAIDNTMRLRRTRGGLAMATDHSLSFDPRAAYWRPPERRVAIAYLSSLWNGRFTPAELVRAHGLHVCTQVDRWRADGRVTVYEADYEKVGGWKPLGEQLMVCAASMPDFSAWPTLKATWKLKEPSAGSHFAEFIRGTLSRADGPRQDEQIFRNRVGWFGYLGGGNAADVTARQRFFFGYINLLTSTNSYMYGGASQTFAAVIQNTTSDVMLSLIAKWQSSDLSPGTTGFMTLGSNDDRPVERKHHNVVKELYGFLCLEAVPFVNGATEKAYCDEYGTADAYAAVRLAGSRHREWLHADPARVSALASHFDTLWSAAQSRPHKFAQFESVDRNAYFKATGDTAASLVNGQLELELRQAADDWAASLPEQDKAMCALHLLLDGWICHWPNVESKVVPLPPAPTLPPAATPPPVPPPNLIELPSGLREAGERSLAYLRAGSHVLLAGAPGTGKTTLAQFVAHAWNQQAHSLASAIAESELPTTVVAHSGWSPFHTVGGFVQNKEGTWDHSPGVFVEADGLAWRLKNSAIVLDEMNRADLDRSIGDLYPLLSCSVAQVLPAGIPGVGVLRLSERFRVVATVNDSNLDDIVFPISEGLARRFVRIELKGASKDDVQAYVAGNASPSERLVAAQGIVTALFTELAASKWELAVCEGDDYRLPFGAGYFRLLRQWVAGALEMPATLEVSADDAVAQRVLDACLAGAVRQHRPLKEILAALAKVSDV